jgi:hypothetical protein
MTGRKHTVTKEDKLSRKTIARRFRINVSQLE